MKSQNGSLPPKKENVKSYQPLGRVVRKESAEKPKYVPKGRVARKKT